jgi:oligopeptidase A
MTTTPAIPSSTFRPAAFRRHPPEHVTPAIEQLIAKAAPWSRSWKRQRPGQLGQLRGAAGGSHRALGRAWGIVNHLNNVVDTPELRATYNENQPKVTEFWTELARTKRCSTNTRPARLARIRSLSPARKRIVENALRDFRLGGAELPAEQKERFAEIQEQHAAVSTRFSENVLDATNDYKLLVADEADLAGLPDDAKAAARAAAERDGKPATSSRCTSRPTSRSCNLPTSRELRETIYRANATKASDMGAVFSEVGRVGQHPATSPSC